MRRDMAGWYSGRTVSWQGRALMAAGLLTVVLVAVVPVALVTGLFMMLLGHVVAGLALFGGSVLAAIGAFALTVMGGTRHLRTLIRRQTRQGEQSQQHPSVVRLDQDDYRIS